MPVYPKDELSVTRMLAASGMVAKDCGTIFEWLKMLRPVIFHPLLLLALAMDLIRTSMGR
jgi:hypothetical protein